MKKVIVLDLDGTVARTELYWLPVLEVIHAAIRRKFGLQTALADPRDALKLLGKPDHEIYAILYPGLEEKTYPELIAFGDAIWQEMLPRFPYTLFDDVLPTLEKLKARGFDLFVSSNCDLNYLRQLTQATGLAPLLSDAVCAEHYPGMHKWEFTQKMLAPLLPVTGCFVGDSAHDMIAGRKNNLTTVYAAYGYAQEPDADTIDIRIQTFSELEEVIIRWPW